MSKAYGVTDTGRVKDRNEDAYLTDEEMALAIVCDGVSTKGHGDAAARLTCQKIRDHLLAQDDRLKQCRKVSHLFNRSAVFQLIQEAVEAANASVVETAKDSAQQGMACTLAMVIQIGSHAVIASAGDSRVYLCRQGKVHQITEDHSVAVNKLRKGASEVRALYGEDQATLLTRAIGYSSEIKPDLIMIELMASDRFLLCSDGLSDYIDIAELEQFFRRHTDSVLPKQLVNTASERGGHDNITAVVMGVGFIEPGMEQEVLKKFELLQKNPLFEKFDLIEIMRLLNACSIATYDRGARVIEEGEMQSDLYLCVTGSLLVSKKNRKIAMLGPGDFFGELSLIDRQPRSADVLAREKTCVLIISRQELFSQLNNSSRLASKFLWPLCHALTRRLRSTSDDLAEGRTPFQGI